VHQSTRQALQTFFGSLQADLIDSPCVKGKVVPASFCMNLASLFPLGGVAL